MSTRDEGFVAAEWAIAVVIVVLPVLMTVVTVATWAERGAVARTVADESARAAVLAQGPEDVVPAALRVARATASSRGLEVAPRCRAKPERCLRVEVDGVLERGASIAVTVQMPMPGVRLPFVGELGAFHWATTVIERVDDYRGLR